MRLDEVLRGRSPAGGGRVLGDVWQRTPRKRGWPRDGALGSTTTTCNADGSIGSIVVKPSPDGGTQSGSCIRFCNDHLPCVSKLRWQPLSVVLPTYNYCGGTDVTS